MDKLQWFKFTPFDWMMGKIQRCDEICQARFMRLCCLYWNKECSLSYEDAEIEIEKQYLDILILKKIIKVKDSLIVIEFLDEQVVTIAETSEKRKKAVQERWKKAKQIDTSVLQTDTSVIQSDTEKIREEEIREEKIYSFKKSLLDYGFNNDLVDEWLKVRKNKKLTNTETAFKKFIKQVELCSLDKNLILEKCVEKSWGGFEADWMKKETTKNKYTPEQLKEARMRCVDWGEPLPVWFNQEDKHLIGL